MKTTKTLTAPMSAPYTRYTLSDKSRQQSFAVYDDPRYGVAVTTTVWFKNSTYPMETNAHVSREVARKIYALALSEGLRLDSTFRNDRSAAA